MTALAGYWSFGAGSMEPGAGCARMLQAQAIYATQPPIIRRDGPVALGRALYPMLPEDDADRGVLIGGGGRWTLVADVRLDDRDGLCATLAIARDEARGLADATIVMRAIERWEEEAIGRLVGDFAIGLWDRDRARLILARDFAGQRPLHVHHHAGFVAFASMSKGLHAIGVPRAPNDRMIAEYLLLTPGDTSDSYFAGIDRILPGEIRTITPRGTTTRRHWTFAPRAPLGSAGEHVDAVREVFDAAVRARLRGAEGGVAAHLSGGLDSSAVAAGAATQIGGVVAFTAVPSDGFSPPTQRGRFADEGAHAAAVAALHPAIEHVLIRTGGRSPIAAFDRNFDLFGRPTPNPSNAVWLGAINDAAQERGLRVLLTGQMGNMTTSYRAPDARGPQHLMRRARQAWRLHRSGGAGAGVYHVVGAVLPRSVRALALHALGARRPSRLVALVDPVLAASIRQQARQQAERSSGDTVRERLAVMANSDRGNFTKGNLAGWGIDMRDPTADRRLVELCLSIPLAHYAFDGRPRAIARHAFADLLPVEIRDEPGKGLQAADWHIGLTAHLPEIRAEVERIAVAAAPGRVIDIQRMRALLARLPTGGWNDPGTQIVYRDALLRGISAGHFMRRASGPG